MLLSYLMLITRVNAMRHFFFAVSVAVGQLSFLSVLNAEDTSTSADGVDAQVLFNGTNLDGWIGDPRLWSVRDGVIHGETTETNAAKGNTFLIWQGGKPADFQMELSFRCNATNNSGIQYRSKHITDSSAENDWVVRGYQHELRNENKYPNVSSFIYDEGGKRGRICLTGEKARWNANGKESLGEFLNQENFMQLMKVDDWNDVKIVAKGNHIEHYLNGQLVLDFTDNDPKLTLLEGVIALQLHAGKPMFAEFKNIQLTIFD